MVTYMAIPKVRVTFGGTVTDGLINAKVELAENNYWTAQLNFRNVPSIYPATVDIGTSVLIDVQDGAVGGAWTNLFTGTVLYPDYSFEGSSAVIGLQCVGVGYALNMMNVAEEYGTQSRNPAVDTIQSALTDAGVGIIPKWVEHYKATANDSGYTIDTSKVESLAGTIPYMVFPWKPANKCLDDLCDLVTAIGGGTTAGPHWLVDNSGNLRVKRVGVTQVGWTLYYGDSEANATLVNGVDFFDGDFQPVGKEANVVLYSGVWRRPANGDGWTGPGCDSIFEGLNYPSQLSVDTTNCIVGPSSLKCLVVAVGGSDAGCYIPTGATTQAHWNFNIFSDFNIPTMNFYVRKHGGITNCYVGVYNTDPTTGATIAYGTTLLSTDMAADDKFYHFSFPLGQYYNTGERFQDFKWYGTGTLDWSDINKIIFYWHSDENAYVNIDGFYFGDATLSRIARQEFPSEVVAGRGTLGTTTNPIRFKVLIDDVGKDDSLLADDDTGLCAQLAKAELLRACKATINGKFTTPMIKDIMPGQYIHIEKDYRITKLTQSIQGKEFKTMFEVTDDLTNSHTRLRYEDINKQYAAIRPQYQDRESTSLKGALDIRVLPLEKAYNI